MVLVLVLYEEVPEPERYAQHARCATRAGGDFGNGPMPSAARRASRRYRYMAEFEFPDMDVFKAAARPRSSPPPADAAELGSRSGPLRDLT